MNEKRVILVFFAVLVSVVFPVAIACHSHQYADGAYFFLRLIESGKANGFGMAPARIGQYLMTQGPVVLAQNCGLSSVRGLSWVYGFTLFYLPCLAFAGACIVYLRAAMPTHALVTALLYAVCLHLTSFFIISESHLAASLFILSLALLTAGNLRKWPTHLALFALWLAGLSVYEFWAIYFPALFVVLVFLPRTRRPTWLLGILGPLYWVGACVNGYAIIWTPLTVNRDAMLGSHLLFVWPILLLVSLLFTCVIGLALSPARSRSREWVSNLLDRLLATGCFAWARLRTVDLIQMGVSVLTAIACVGVLLDLNGNPRQAYALRILNLILPLLFVLFLVLYRVQDPGGRSPRSNRTLTSALAGLLVVASMTLLHHSLGFLKFRWGMYETMQAASGYVARSAILQYDHYGWEWTYPTMSLLSYAMREEPIQSVVYNPRAEWEPFGPADFGQLKMTARRLGLALADESGMAKQALEVTARKLAEPQR